MSNCYPNNDSIEMISPESETSQSISQFRRFRNFLFNFLLYFHNSIIFQIPSHTIRQFFLRHFMQVTIGKDSAILMGLRLYTKAGVVIGENCVIDRDCVLDGRGGIKIGNHVNLAPEVMILTASHDPDDADGFRGVYKPVVVEDYVWIATRSLILPGVHIGAGAVIGAGSVVTKDVEAGMIVAGNPARVIRKRQGVQKYVLNYKRLFH